MRKGFNPEGLVWKPLGVLADFFLLSLMWFLCTVPIITLGASTTALYDTVVHSIRNREEDIFTRFFRTFKNEWKGSIPSVLLWGVVLTGLFLWYRVFAYNVGTSRMAYTVSVALIALLATVLGICCWVWPILSRYTFGFSSLNITALKLAISHPLRTVLMGFVTAAGIWLCVKYTVPVVILPSLTAFIWSLLIEPVFKKLNQHAQQRAPR